MSVLDNHPTKSYRPDVVEQRLADDKDVERHRFELLVAEASPRPELDRPVADALV